MGGGDGGGRVGLAMLESSDSSESGSEESESHSSEGASPGDSVVGAEGDGSSPDRFILRITPPGGCWGIDHPEMSSSAFSMS